MFALWSQDVVARYSGQAHDLHGHPIPLTATSPADSDRILDFFLYRAAQGLGFRWAMIEDGAFVGAIGFNQLTPAAELAWHLHPAHWGRGLATEAVRAALDWLAAEGSAARVEAFIDPENEASARLAERLGFERSGGERWALVRRL